HLLERILGNFLSNAVRYTQRGRILLGCRRRGGKLRIEVWDTGFGIPEQERQRIFEEFHQLHNDARERRRGTGLGLAIVRRLADILGHEILVRSVPGQGSVFAVELEARGRSVRLPGLAPETPGRRPDRPTTVLVVDDDQQIRKGMVRALESWGCVVRTAGNYGSAAAIMCAAPDAVDLIIADYRLPDACNGARLADRLRTLCRRPVPALLVTADQGQEEMQEIANHGFLALRKPVAPDALRAAMGNLLGDFPQTAADAERL
ncbi:MAG TPA: ATP-binding protein, partial [Kiloniellaceae bacterium]|nr:ATP-binding protein [Kiloniellaceae bacterium]